MTSTWIAGVDGSDRSRTALAWAVAQATGRGAFEMRPFSTEDLTEARRPVEIDDAEAAFHGAVDAIEGDDRHAERIFRVASARQALADASEGADLVVVGARGAGRMVATLLGSVSTWMLHNATCTTVVVPASTGASPIA